MEVKKLALSNEASDALHEATALFESALGVLPPLRPETDDADLDVDRMEENPVQAADGEGNPSSVKQRKRKGKGVAAHDLRAGHCETFGDFFLPGGGFTSMALSIAGGDGGGSYLNRRLLSYYLSGMAEHHHALKSLDFYRGEEMWDGRYNFDHENRIEGVVDEMRADDDYYRYQSMQDASDRLAAEIRMTDDLFSADDFARREALDDYHRYNSR